MARTAALSLIAALVWTAACSQQPARPPVSGAVSTYRGTPAQRSGGALVLAGYEDPAGLDPLTARTDTELRLDRLLFAPLWGFDDALKPYPDLAARVPDPARGEVRVAAGGRSMTVDVRLRPGLHWSDGQPLTAGDVVFTWQAMSDPATGAVLPPGFERLRSVRALSPTEVRLTFDGVEAAYLAVGAGLFVMPRHRLQGVPFQAWSADPFFQRPDAVSGPFTVADRVPGVSLTLARNPLSTAGPGHHPAHLDRIVLRLESGRAAVLRDLRTGGADLVDGLDPADLRGTALQGLAGAAPRETTSSRQVFLHPARGGPAAPPWAGDPEVLEALAMAVDRGALAAAAGSTAPATGLFPDRLSAYEGALRLDLNARPDAASALLEGDGWTPGPGGVRVKAGRPLTLSLLAACDDPAWGVEVDLLRAQWAAAGASLQAGCRSHQALLDADARGEADLTLLSDEPGPDPAAWAPLAARCGDAALDADFARGEGTLDPARRRAAYQAAAGRWQAIRCTIPLYWETTVAVASTRLRNFRPSPLSGAGTWNAADWWLAAA